MTKLISTILTALAWLYLGIGSPLADEEIRKTDRGIVRTSAGGGCAAFSNLGTVAPTIINNCNRSVVVEVENFDRNARLVAERTIHLRAKVGNGPPWERPLLFPGYRMVIESESDWRQGNGEDGTRYLSFREIRRVEGFAVWGAKNSSSDRYLAFQYRIVRNGRSLGSVGWVLEPGERNDRQWGGWADSEYVVTEWAIIDPR